MKAILIAAAVVITSLCFIPQEDAEAFRRYRRTAPNGYSYTVNCRRNGLVCFIRTRRPRLAARVVYNVRQRRQARWERRQARRNQQHSMGSHGSMSYNSYASQGRTSYNMQSNNIEAAPTI